MGHIDTLFPEGEPVTPQGIDRLVEDGNKADAIDAGKEEKLSGDGTTSRFSKRFPFQRVLHTTFVESNTFSAHDVGVAAWQSMAQGGGCW